MSTGRRWFLRKVDNPGRAVEWGAAGLIRRIPSPKLTLKFQECSPPTIARRLAPNGQ